MAMIELPGFRAAFGRKRLFPFRFDRTAAGASALGVTPATSGIEVTAGQVLVRHGPWRATVARPGHLRGHEPYAGGHIIDRGTDGTECRWARVLAYDPPRRVCFSWDINLAWQLQTDRAKTSEVEVTFTPDGPARTRVVLTHRHLDRHGDDWQNMRDAVGSGWSLTRFAETAAQH